MRYSTKTPEQRAAELEIKREAKKERRIRQQRQSLLELFTTTELETELSKRKQDKKNDTETI